MNRAIRFAAAAAVSALMVYAAAVPAGAAGPFDGPYRGNVKLVMARTARNFGAGANNCRGNAAGMPATRRVVNNTIKLNYLSSDVELAVGPDGTISGSGNVGQNTLSASGKITGNTMVMEYGTPFCTFRFEGQKGG